MEKIISGLQGYFEDQCGLDHDGCPLLVESKFRTVAQGI
jgi:hypothetical protein